MKKIFAFLLSGLLAVTTLTACGGGGASSTAESKAETSGGSEAQSTSTAAPTEKAKVFVFVKNRGDLSYWDSIAAGGDRAAKELADRADVKVIETTQDLTANLTAMYEAADDGADLIITAGDFKDNLVEIANEYPNIACVIISENVVDQAKNIYGFDFRVSEASFLAGVVAADRAAQDKADTIGFIGGVDEVAVIQEFFVGYIQGAKYANPDIKIVYNYVGGWGDPDTARTQALAQFNDAKAAIIFACAGGSGNGVHTAAAEVGKYVIGVDSDQSKMYEADKKVQERFVTSVLKMCDNAVFDTITEYLDKGTLPFGEMRVLGVAENAVGIVENDLFNKLVSADGIKKLDEARADISSGKVSVWSAIGKEQSEIKAKIAELIG